MPAICQTSLRDAPWMQPKTRRLPGIQPLDWSDWIQVDEAYAPQMAERARLLEARRNEVLLMTPAAEMAAKELLGVICVMLAGRDDFDVDGARVARPDGVTVEIDPNDPLMSINRLITEDVCILQKRGGEHVLTAGLLCFPASWLLHEKMNQPLTAIHQPVSTYTTDVAARVQRLFDAVRADKPLWRTNALHYNDPDLFQPLRDTVKRVVPEGQGYIRSERQSILRLPKSDAIVFSIHTRLVAFGDLTPAQRAGLRENPLEHALDVSALPANVGADL